MGLGYLSMFLGSLSLYLLVKLFFKKKKWIKKNQELFKHWEAIIDNLEQKEFLGVSLHKEAVLCDVGRE